MKASEIVSALEAHGARLRAVDERIDLEAACEPPRALLDELTKKKHAVLAFLVARATPAPALLPPFELTLSTFAAPSIRWKDEGDKPRREPRRRLFRFP